MRLRSTLGLLLITGVMLFALLRGREWVPDTRVREAHLAQPLSFEAEKIDEIEIESREGNVRISVQEHLWHVGAPLNDLADVDRVESLLKALRDAEWLQAIDASEVNAALWKQTGLDRPHTHLRLISAGTVKAECWLGQAAALEGTSYVSVPSSLSPSGRSSHVVRSPLLSVLAKPLATWRDERLVRVPPESISRVTLADGTSTIELSRANPKAPWQMTKPLQLRANTVRLKALLGALTDLKVTSFAPIAKADPAPANGALEITIVTPLFTKPVSVRVAKPISESPTSTTVIAPHRDQQCEVTGEKLSQLWAELNDLRDPHLAAVKVDDLSMIAILNPDGNTTELRKHGNDWQFYRHGAWARANSDRVERMFEALNEHEVLEFVSDSAANLEPFGLHAPFLTLAWNREETANAAPVVDGSTSKLFTAEPFIGANTALLFGQDKEGNAFAKYEGEPFVYRVSASVLSAIPRDAARWNSLTPVRFSQFALTQIRISIGTNPPVELNYDPVTADWSGNRAGQDFTDRIDRVRADQLAGKLAELTAQDWLQDRTEGAKALLTPQITVHVTLLTEAGNPASPKRVMAVNFAPTTASTSSPMYYGRVDAAPDIFLISKVELLGILGRSVMR